MPLHPPRYSENIITDPGHVDIFPASRIPRQIQHLLKPIYRMTSGVSKEPLGSLNDEQEKGFRIITEPRTLSTVLQWTADDQVAFIFWIQEINHSSPHFIEVETCIVRKIIVSKKSITSLSFCYLYVFSKQFICQHAEFPLFFWKYREF